MVTSDMFSYCFMVQRLDLSKGWLNKIFPNLKFVPVVIVGPPPCEHKAPQLHTELIMVDVPAVNVYVLYKCTGLSEATKSDLHMSWLKGACY